jgi:hypothetical protein
LISAAPSGSPCALAVPARLGEPLPMVVLQMISVGLSARSSAWVDGRVDRAASWPSTGPITFQP